MNGGNSIDLVEELKTLKIGITSHFRVLLVQELRFAKLRIFVDFVSTVVEELWRGYILRTSSILDGQ